jgi:hypothetical protein
VDFLCGKQVDAAYAGSAMICPEFRHMFEGIEVRKIEDVFPYGCRQVCRLHVHIYEYNCLQSSSFLYATRIETLETQTVLCMYMHVKLHMAPHTVQM